MTAKNTAARPRCTNSFSTHLYLMPERLTLLPLWLILDRLDTEFGEATCQSMVLATA